MHATSEDYITLTEAANRSPGRPSTNCVWRWCRKGVVARSGERVRLQHVRIGGRIFTTATWLTAFGQQLAAADTRYFESQQSATAVPAPRAKTRSEQERLAAIERAERSLTEAGV